MRFCDLIIKKRNSIELLDEEIKFMVEGYVSGEILDYQMSAMLMAIYFNGLSDRELATLTKEMSNSGEIVDLSSIKGIKVDKHSTGGVGDKTTLIIGSIVATYGVKIAKMSGRGLGHTGGTIDKMESIPNLRTTLTQEEFCENVNKIGISVMGQSSKIAPADKMLYALRDVTGTVESIPLIAASIMSKKLAAGSDCILLDVKTGSGAFMKDIDSSIELAKKMVSIGELAGKKTIALITNMDQPLGNNIGNSLEIKEVVNTLNGEGPEDLTDICLELSANMLYLANKGTLQECKKMALDAIKDKSAINKLIEMVEAQGGDSNYIKNLNNFKNARYSKELLAKESGYINYIDAEICGISSALLGAGRETIDSEIDFSAGIVLNKKVGDFVEKDELIATMYSSEKNKFYKAEQKLESAIKFDLREPKKSPLILAKVEKDNLLKFV